MEFVLVLVIMSNYLVKTNTETELQDKYSLSAKKTGLHIAVLASNPDLYSNKRIMEAGRARGHDMVFLNVDQV